MKKSILIISALLLLSGCSNSSTITDEKDQKIAELTQQMQSKNLDLQTQCSKQAKNFFDYYLSSHRITGEGDEFSSHYNVQLNKCFILIKEPYYSTGIGSDTASGEELYDAIEQKRYGHWVLINNSVMTVCQMYLNKDCQDYAEFHRFTESYMEN